MVAEREARAPRAARQPDRGPPLEVRIGNDQGGRFGEASGTSLAEKGRADKERLPPDVVLPPPPPEVLARAYLQNAGYKPTDLADVRALLRKAEDNSTFEKQVNGLGANRAW